MVRTLLPS